jgi:hypothetical protein
VIARLALLAAAIELQETDPLNQWLLQLDI